MTLLHNVPVPLGVAHQGGAMALTAALVWALHTLGYVTRGRGPKAVASAAAAVAKKL
jgi:heme A synthase